MLFSRARRERDRRPRRSLGSPRPTTVILASAFAVAAIILSATVETDPRLSLLHLVAVGVCWLIMQWYIDVERREREFRAKGARALQDIEVMDVDFLPFDERVRFRQLVRGVENLYGWSPDDHAENMRRIEGGEK